jgi:hypothetical protein
MIQKERKRFQSGCEVFEKYIPGYTSPHIDFEEYSWEFRSSPKEIADNILSNFVDKLSEVLDTKLDLE